MGVNSSERLCFGFVGVGSKNRRFCLKAVKAGTETCGVSKHATKFSPKRDNCYLRSNDVVAFCEPSFPLTLVPDDLRDNIKVTAKTIEEWKLLFADYLRENGNQSPQVAEASRYLFPDPEKFALKTPRKIPLFEGEFPAVVIPTELINIQDQQRSLPVEQFWWEEEDSTSLLPSPLFDFLKKLRNFLIKYDQWLVEPLDVMTLRLDTVEGDLHKLKNHCETLELAIGGPLSLQGSSFPDLWSALEFVASNLNGTDAMDGSANFRQTVASLQNIVNDLSVLPSTCSTLSLKLAELNTSRDTFEARFQRIHPILLTVRDLQVKVLSLETIISSQRTAVNNNTSVSPDPWSN